MTHNPGERYPDRDNLRRAVLEDSRRRSDRNFHDDHDGLLAEWTGARRD